MTKMIAPMKRQVSVNKMNRPKTSRQSLGPLKLLFLDESDSLNPDVKSKSVGSWMFIEQSVVLRRLLSVCNPVSSIISIFSSVTKA